MSDATFTQADVDRIVRERLAEAKAKHDTIVTELRTQLGERDTTIATLKPRAEAADAAARELVAFKEESVRTEAFRESGLSGEDKAAIRDRITKLHAALEPVNDKGEAIPLHTWLREHAASDPLVGPMLVQTQGAPPAAGGSPDTRVPPPGAGGAPPPRVPVGAPGRAPDPSRPLSDEQIKATHRQMLTDGKIAEAREFIKQHVRS